MSKRRELCDGCKGLGCFTCGMSGFVEVEKIDLSNVPKIGPTSFRVRPAGSRVLLLPAVAVLDARLGHRLKPQEMIDEHDRVFLLRLSRGYEDGTGEWLADVELVPV